MLTGRYLIAMLSKPNNPNKMRKIVIDKIHNITGKSKWIKIVKWNMQIEQYIRVAQK